jgi:hypothetical protein
MCVSNPVNPSPPNGPKRETPITGVAAIGNGVLRVGRNDGSHAIAFGVVDGPRTWVFLDGRTYVVESAPVRRAGSGHDSTALSAPMPATVTQIHVEPGQQVRAGDVLITLEAMKMELPIRAAVDATVIAVNCRAGEMVQPGNPLVELTDARTPNPEPEPEPRTRNPEVRTEPEHVRLRAKRYGETSPKPKA